MVQLGTLAKVAGLGGLAVSATGYFLMYKLADRVRVSPYYVLALEELRRHPAARAVLGEPIVDSRFRLSDSQNNFCNGDSAHFSFPVSGPQRSATYEFSAIRKDDVWTLTEAHLAFRADDSRKLVIVAAAPNAADSPR